MLYKNGLISGEFAVCIIRRENSLFNVLRVDWKRGLKNKHSYITVVLYQKNFFQGNKVCSIHA